MTRKSLFDGPGVRVAGQQKSWLSALFLPYARSRQMENGAYSSWRYMDEGLASVKDTFWALRIYENLLSVAPESDRTRQWLDTGLEETWAGGDMENLFYALFSRRMLQQPWPKVEGWLKQSSSWFLTENSEDQHMGGGIRECLLWLQIESKNAVRLDEIRDRIGKYVENCYKSFLHNRVILDLPTYGALIESLFETDKPLTDGGEWLGPYRDDITGYRLTPDSRTGSMETLWWGVWLDQRFSGKNMPDPKKLGMLLDSYRTRNGGYGPRPGAIPDLESTGMALDILLWSGAREDNQN
uniref:Uncharacterized protein n=1 Tax=Leptospirillum ferriphilum TaxID=178606 RepID=A0A7C3R4Z5_9BACT